MDFLTFAVRFLPFFAQGALITIEVTLCGLLLGLVLGVIAALMNISTIGVLRAIGRLYTWAIRGTPLLVQIFIIYAGLPQVGIQLTAFVSGVIALGINSGAYIAEIVRAGILSIDPGQMEAAESLGMTYGLAMRRIIFPQAYRRLLPPIVNEFVALLKDSSLVSVMALTELMRVGQQVSSATLMPMQTYVMVALFYLLMTTVIVFISSRIERRLEARS
ncbi:MAG: amino acid ABC transporter permease [Alicyclobacillus macrosporangiidus]|uniref:amino acid ABC transporter permease n=1 Tax=Alicyclobacillus macrosporangiidus TaxID=392015 RepID=UPI0026EFFEEA|nr:amino acid ABC transporter permease [Alicyclobacillus macrosporangiidus]MCL6599887.1 amino acid ABC transporter permease [Alicyclobacillus macrosporangiidus]